MSKKRQSDLRGFFSAKKLKPVPEETESADSGHSGVSFEDDSVVPVEPRRVDDANLAIDEHDITSKGDSMPGTSKDVRIQKHDIGLFSKTCSDNEKYDFLKNTWNPTSNYKFPPGKRNLKFQHQWLSEFQWLAYSEARQGAFCKLCVVFASDFEAGKGNHVQLGSFVKTPFTKWKNAKQEFRDHEKRGYHSNACLKVQNFFSVFENKVDDIQLQIDTQLKSATEENRKKLCPIVKTVLFCGREGIPLRGHRDHGPLSLEESSSDGKFRSLLRFRMDAGDDILKQHIHNSRANAVYLSKNIQNEIIQIAGELVTNSLVDRIKKSSVFSILADETTDIAGIEQMSLCTRYLDKIDNKYVIREDFLKFVPVFDLRGFALSDIIKEHLSALDLDLNNVRGLGFDGAKNMSGIYNGCAAKFQESYPQATYLHCASHSLNLVLSHSCKVTEIRNCLGTINKIINFFRVSAKREKVLKDKLAEIDPPSKRTRLIKFCETRWVERQDAISLFYEMFPYIVESLEDIQQFNDSDTSSQAFAFSAAILKPVFIVSMIVACRVFNLSMVLATQMQSKQLDLKKCIDSCEKLGKELNTLRDDFKDVFNDILGTAGYVGVEMVLPRVTGQQKHRSNVDTTDPETYYRSTVFLPFIDYVLSELQERFLKHKDVLRTLQILLPKEIVNASNEELVAAVDVFINKWPNDIMKSKTSFVDELKMWRRNFLDLTKEEFNGLPDDFLSSLDKCEEMCFPCTHNVLKNCCVLPVTTSTAERSFSTLRYLKTYLRNSISTDRLNGLALLFIHKAVEVKPETIINELAKKPRRLLLK